MINLWISVILTLLICVGVGATLGWGWAILTLICLISCKSLGNFITELVDRARPIPEDGIEDIIGLQTAVVTCPCGQHTFSAPIFLNMENIFTCEKCASKFRVELTYNSIIITEPVNLEKAFDALKSRELL